MNRSPAAPFLVACFGIFTFAAMDAMMKVLSLGMGTYNALLWRMGVAVVIASTLFLLRRKSWPKRAALRIHLLRGMLTSFMAFLFFWGLVRVPLAEAIGLSFIAPLIALYLAAVLLKEKVGGKAVFASVLGLAGAVVIIGGKLGGEYSDDVGWGIAAILFSAVLYAYNLILQRQQALLADPLEIVFFQSAIVTSIYLLFAPFLAEAPPVEQFGNLLITAVLGICSMFMLSWAYRRAEASILIPVEYTAFVWAALLGWLMFVEEVTLATLAGTALIVIACLVVARQHPEHPEHVETTGV